MYHKIRELAKKASQNFETIPDNRKALLQKITTYIKQKYSANEAINLVYICTHNSRRSHFGQIAAAVAATYYHIDKVKTYSGGTEATAFNINAISALRDLGFDIVSKNETDKNPIWEVKFGDKQKTVCFSKVYDDIANPKKSFAAVMTCSDADENCPYIPGVDIRIGTTYEDPKKSDGTPEQNTVYTERFIQILTETLYAFSLV